jgi:hypothetical protein
MVKKVNGKNNNKNNKKKKKKKVVKKLSTISSHLEKTPMVQ